MKKEPLIIASIDVEKSPKLTTKVQKTRAYDHVGISIRDFGHWNDQFIPKKQGIWLPIEIAEQVAAAILEVVAAEEMEQQEYVLQEMEREAQALRNLSLGCI